MAISLRLDPKTEKAVARYAKLEGRSMSGLIREMISEFLQKKQDKLSPWDLGKDLFGKESSGDGMLSVNRKKTIKDMIDAKKNRH